MISNRENIIAFFSVPKHASLFIENNGTVILTAFNAEKVEDISTDFLREFELIKNIRNKIDKIMRVDEKTQVIRSLKYISRQKISSSNIKIPIFKTLVNNLLFPNWSNPSKIHYRTINEMLIQWKDYFFSYARNKFDSIYQSPEDINEKYRKFIKRALGSNIKKSPEWKKENLLAKAIIKKLREQNHNDFFDINDLDSGDKLEEEISNWCSKSFNLVQLLHITSFNSSFSPRENWCFIEYKNFKKAQGQVEENKVLCLDTLSKRFHFLVTGKNFEDLIPDNNFDEEYDEWVGDIQRRRVLFFDPENRYSENEILIKELSKRMVTIKLRLIENINGL